MRIIVSLLIALAIIQAMAQNTVDMTGIPEEELKALEEAVSFKKAKADAQTEQLKSAKGLFDKLFGDKSQQNNRIQFSRGNGDSNQQQNSFQQQGLNQLLSSLPYEAFLPRRRQQPLGLLNKILQGEEESDDQSESNPMAELDQLLSGKRGKNSGGKKFHWQNPDYKEGQRDAPYMKIFGPKSKKKHKVNVNEEDIQQLLVKYMPSLDGGKILKLSSVPHRKGIFLNIEYETKREQIYTIKAKYQKKTNQIEIISMTQINVLRRVDEDSTVTEDESDQQSVIQQKAAPIEEVTEKAPTVQVKEIAPTVEIKETKTTSETKENAEKVPIVDQKPKSSQKIETTTSEAKNILPNLDGITNEKKNPESSQNQDKKEEIIEEKKDTKTVQETKKVTEQKKEQPEEAETNQNEEQQSAKEIPETENEEEEQEQQQQSDQQLSNNDSQQAEDSAKIEENAKEEKKEKPSEPEKTQTKQKEAPNKNTGSNLSKQPEVPRAIETN